MLNYGTAVSSLKRAASSAVDRIKRNAGQDMDEDLSIYSKLSSEQFRAIGEKYGQDGLIRYIQTMEAKKLRNNDNK